MIISVVTFVILISTNSSFTLYATPLSTWRRVPLMLSTSTLLVWPLKLCDSYSRCGNVTKEVSKVTERNIKLTQKVYVHHQFETALSRLANRRVAHRTFWENKQNAREPNKYIRKVEIENNFDLGSNVRRSSASKRSNSSERNIDLSNNIRSSALNRSNSSVGSIDLSNNVRISSAPNKSNTSVESIDLNNNVGRSSAPNKSNTSVESIHLSNNVGRSSAPNKSTGSVRTKESEFTTSQEFYMSHSQEEFDRRFYYTTFNNLTALHEATRPENGISFVHSGLLLWVTLVGLSTEVDKETRDEIDASLQLNASDVERERIISEIITSLPTSTVDMKFHWGSRLVLRQGKQLSERFRRGPAARLSLKIDYFKGSESPVDMADILNKMVENDSGGTIRNTFDDEDFLLDEVEALLVTTLYLRARWRTAPTLLNGTHTFNSSDLPNQTVRMIRINDVVKYARLDELNAEAIEIFYFNPDLSLLILLPNGNSLRHLAHKISETKLETITNKMRSVRVATILPLYTLRMTLLLPNKLRAMGISRFMSTDNTTEIDSLHITHAVQRLMFWAEAGRYAFKDDGIEWDEKPEREVLIDRPHIFYVRWKNMTLMNGNFVL